MKKVFTIAILSMLAFLCSVFPNKMALAAMKDDPFGQQASPVFDSGYVMIGSDLFAEFGASAIVQCSSIYVSSCSLQEMNGSTVVRTISLDPPSTRVTNSSNFTAWKSYAGSGTSGKRYRIKAIFYGNGYTITRYSNIVTCD